MSGFCAHHRTIGREAARAVSAHQVVVDHRFDVVQSELLDLHQFVRSPKAVEKVNKRDTRLERRRVGDERHVHHFLDGV